VDDTAVIGRRIVAQDGGGRRVLMNVQATLRPAGPSLLVEFHGIGSALAPGIYREV
jgi:hypothetical protein